MIFVITLWHSQLQMSPSLTHKCCPSAIISNFLRLWKLNSMIMKVKSTGHSCCAKIYLLDQKQLWLFGFSNKNVAMSHALCETIPIQNLMKEICIISMPNPMTNFCITVHEDNLSAIAMYGGIIEVHALQ
jgi:hypothetical protein